MSVTCVVEYLNSEDIKLGRNLMYFVYIFQIYTDAIPEIITAP